MKKIYHVELKSLQRIMRKRLKKLYCITTNIPTLKARRHEIQI
jgi:hypothetical protein